LILINSVFFVTKVVKACRMLSDTSGLANDRHRQAPVRTKMWTRYIGHSDVAKEHNKAIRLFAVTGEAGFIAGLLLARSPECVSGVMLDR
jgi:hypothetical protein